MTKSRLMNKLRRQDWYKPLMEELKCLGVSDYEILEPSGRGHPILRIDFGGKTPRMPVPSTGGVSSATYVRSNLRKAMRNLGEA